MRKLGREMRRIAELLHGMWILMVTFLVFPMVTEHVSEYSPLAMGFFFCGLVAGASRLYVFCVVEKIEAEIPQTPEKDLPTIDQFIGSDPDFTGGESTKEYIDHMRGD